MLPENLNALRSALRDRPEDFPQAVVAELDQLDALLMQRGLTIPDPIIRLTVPTPNLCPVCKKPI